MQRVLNGNGMENPKLDVYIWLSSINEDDILL